MSLFSRWESEALRCLAISYTSVQQQQQYYKQDDLIVVMYMMSQGTQQWKDREYWSTTAARVPSCCVTHGDNGRLKLHLEWMTLLFSSMKPMKSAGGMIIYRDILRLRNVVYVETT